VCQIKILIINTHLTYQGWSEGKLNFTFMQIAKTLFVERGDAVAETFIERPTMTNQNSYHYR